MEYIEKVGCEFCEEGTILIEKEFLSTNLIGLNPKMLATDLFGSEYIEGVFVDRGYLRLADMDDCNCMDHGEKIKINYCPMCGGEL